MIMDKLQKPMVNIESDSNFQELNQVSNQELIRKLSKNKKRYSTNSDLLLREVAGEYLLIPTGSSADSINGMISLNESFYFIWKQFEEPHTIYEVIQSAMEEYDDPDGEIAKDIYRFVLESLKIGFVKEVK